MFVYFTTIKKKGENKTQTPLFLLKPSVCYHHLPKPRPHTLDSPQRALGGADWTLLCVACTHAKLTAIMD